MIECPSCNGDGYVPCFAPEHAAYARHPDRCPCCHGSPVPCEWCSTTGEVRGSFKGDAYSDRPLTGRGSMKRNVEPRPPGSQRFFKPVADVYAEVNDSIWEEAEASISSVAVPLQSEDTLGIGIAISDTIRDIQCKRSTDGYLRKSEAARIYGISLKRICELANRASTLKINGKSAVKTRGNKELVLREYLDSCVRNHRQSA